MRTRLMDAALPGFFAGRRLSMRIWGAAVSPAHVIAAVLRHVLEHIYIYPIIRKMNMLVNRESQFARAVSFRFL